MLRRSHVRNLAGCEPALARASYADGVHWIQMVWEAVLRQASGHIGGLRWTRTNYLRGSAGLSGGDAARAVRGVDRRERCY